MPSVSGSGGILLPVPARYEAGYAIVDLLEPPARPWPWDSRTCRTPCRGQLDRSRCFPAPQIGVWRPTVDRPTISAIQPEPGPRILAHSPLALDPFLHRRLRHESPRGGERPWRPGVTHTHRWRVYNPAACTACFCLVNPSRPSDRPINQPTMPT